MDSTALHKLGYGLYVLTANADGVDNGCIINTLMQVTSTQLMLAVITINKQNHTHDMVIKTNRFNTSVLTVDAPFSVFERFGFQSGATVDKFADYNNVARSANGLVYLLNHTNAYLSCEVLDKYDFGTHTVFKAQITDGKVINDVDSLTYAHYHKHTKSQPQPTARLGWQCGICGYVFEEEVLPDDFICPWCKHGASDFSQITK